MSKRPTKADYEEICWLADKIFQELDRKNIEPYKRIGALSLVLTDTVVTYKFPEQEYFQLMATLYNQFREK